MHTSAMCSAFTCGGNGSLLLSLLEPAYVDKYALDMDCALINKKPLTLFDSQHENKKLPVQHKDLCTSTGA